MNVIALAFGLGVAGFDVLGVVLVVLLVASKIPKQKIATFAFIVLAGAVTACRYHGARRVATCQSGVIFWPCHRDYVR